MVICAIVGCGNRSGRDREKSFYRLPSVIHHQGLKTECLSRKRRDTWLAKIKREDVVPEQYYNIRVCSDHFITSSPSNLYDETNPDWAPSLKLVFEYKVCSQTSDRYERAVKRRRVTMCSEESTGMEEEEERTGDQDDIVNNTNPRDNDELTKDVAVQTELTMLEECPEQLREISIILYQLNNINSIINYIIIKLLFGFLFFLFLKIGEFPAIRAVPVLSRSTSSCHSFLSISYGSSLSIVSSFSL